MYANILSEKNVHLVLDLLKKEVTIALLVVFFLWVHYYLFVKNRSNRLPGPIGLPFFGYWPFLTKDPHITLNKLSKRYGNIFGMYLGGKYAVVCNNDEIMKEALSKSESLNRPLDLFSKVPLGLGFANLNGQEWITQRRFCIKTMREIGIGRPEWEELVQEEVNDLVKHILSSQGQSTDVEDMLGGTFANNILTMLSGHRRPYGDPEVRRLIQNVYLLMEYFPALELGTFMPRLNNFLLELGVRGSKKTIGRFKEFSDYINKCIKEILETKELFEKESFVKTYFHEVKQNKKEKLNIFTDDNFLSNTQLLVLAGSDTVNHTFIWLLVSMAEHPEKQLKVHQELDTVLGENGTIKYAERTKVPYTFATIMESMRWKTLVPIDTLRIFSEDTTLQGYHIPKDTIIVSNIWAIHNDPKYWKNPEKFEPERFILEDGKSVNLKPDSYVPFSFGRRMCPGEMIALAEVLCYFVTIMRKFTVLPPKGHTKVKLDTQLGLTCRPMGVKLRFVARE
ncbi:hypothetical protein JTE90_017896 [Oedothorax gibbosus]|uniref:Cytochrome P450 n=1 Tax=Oedothorax gibbosus TaxID=931172 RepID=A0AAV6VHL1_9ARAC|nr:hypothetical protein JTE90_017896 [Oedothorax gibbosus]